MYFQKFKDETSKLFRLPNLFVLYYKIDKPSIYNGRQLNMYKQTKKSIENNFNLFI